jgi:hypothetical protein
LVLFGALAIDPVNGALGNAIGVALFAFLFYALVWALRRFGLLASLAAAAFDVSITVPFSLSSWYASRSLIELAIPIAVAAWALWVILSAQRRPATLE